MHWHRLKGILHIGGAEAGTAYMCVATAYFANRLRQCRSGGGGITRQSGHPCQPGLAQLGRVREARG